ncbi:MAG: HK97 family phage prohead protease [Candidatus Thermoplasmatota archaeon]|nr:HK97 family phage prohead protease [Candidatus Thermoplasmatota archaeon]
MDLEKRFIPFEASEIRVEGKENERKITGYAAVFNRRSENLGGFVEIIRPGAFKEAIKSTDVRALFNHDSNYVIGRTTSNTLKLEENQKGLRYEAIPPDTQWARDLLKSIERGDISQCSFSFRVAKDGDKWTEVKTGEEAGVYIREINKILYVGDVGPVTFPAYPQTSVQARALFAEAGLDFDGIAGLIVRAQRGLLLTDSDRDLINASIQILQSYIPGADRGGPDTHTDGDSRRLELLLLELELAERKQLRSERK